MRNIVFYGLLALLGGPSLTVLAQEKGVTPPPMVNTRAELTRLAQGDSTQQLIELKSLMPKLVYDLRYATKNNFTKQRMYPRNTRVAYLRLSAARSLQKVQEKLQKKGLGLKIYDAYRPYEVTVKFWNLIKDERYVAHPAKGSGHNRGTAVDLTIIDLSTGEELNMGTGYDDFSEKAHHSYWQLSEEVLTNRKLLRDLMQEAGFVLFETEWWHYSLVNAGRYDLLNLSFKQIQKKL